MAVDFSKDDKLLASGDESGTIKVWKVADGKCLRTLSTQLSEGKASITGIRLNYSSSKVYASCLDYTIKVYGLKSGALQKELKGHESFI